jgi:hypothetical protein
MAAGQTFTLIHKGERLVVVEGQKGEVEFRMGDHRIAPKAKSFNAAVKEATKYLLDHAGGMKGTYER